MLNFYSILLTMHSLHKRMEKGGFFLFNKVGGLLFSFHPEVDVGGFQYVGSFQE